MYRSALRSSPRIANSLRQSAIQCGGRRFASTTPANKSRSWKSSALRWGIAIGAVYYYNTSNAFAEEPISKTIEPPAQFSDEDLPTVEAVVAQKRREAEARLRKAAASDPALSDTTAPTAPTAPAQDVTTDSQALPPAEPAEGSPEALEQEADQQGAFNPETGEINWECPCLGGMAHGPCGEEFKAAFSCFVYSKEEPKGMDCIDKFQHMQDCFREHPEVYGDELRDDEEAEAQAQAQAPIDDAAPEAAARTQETETTRPAADERRNVAESSKSSAPAGDAKKSKVPTGSELPADVKDTASPE